MRRPTFSYLADVIMATVKLLRHYVVCYRPFSLTAILDGRSQIKVHTDKRTQVHSAQCSLVVTHPSTNRDRRDLTTVNETPS